MRASILIAVAILLLIVTALAVITPGVADDNDDQRLDDLETRVAALETRVAGASTPSASASSSQQNDSSSSSSSSNSSSVGNESNQSNSTNSSFTATYSGNGDRQVEIEIDTAGTYEFTATVTSAFSADLVNEKADVVPEFTIEATDAGTVTRSAALEPGVYVLNVSATSTWNAVLMLVS